MTLPMKALAPHPKVGAGAIGGAVSVVLLWILHQYLGVNPPNEVAAAISTLFMVVVAYAVPGGVTVDTTELASADQLANLTTSLGGVYQALSAAIAELHPAQGSPAPTSVGSPPAATGVVVDPVAPAQGLSAGTPAVPPSPIQP